jgi:hypothetical protein
MSPDRVKKEKVMDDLEYLHYQTQLEEQERDELLADGLLLPEVWPQLKDSNQAGIGEKE